MTATTTPPPPPAGPGSGSATRGDRVRWVARGVGQTLITAGLVILLFVVYEVWVTNLFAARQQHAVASRLQQAWASGKDPETGADARVGLPGGTQSTIPAGTGIANIYIPSFGKDYAFTIVQGTADADLEKGPGHYDGTPLPSDQPGNVGVAGHRVGKGEPFLNLDQLVPGDAVVIQTRSDWYVYSVLGRDGDLSAPDANGVPGREIVSPSDVGVIAPTPDRPGAPATGRYLTLTTCHPKYSATQRMIVHATLSAVKPAQGGTLPTELGGTL